MVLGEPQILGQMREAWEIAQQCGTAGPELRFLMPRLLGLAKRVRKESGLSTAARSAAHAAVDLALTNSAMRTLVIGAGKMAALSVRHLRNRGVTAIHVANRTFQQAVDLCEAYRACPVDYSQIYALLPTFDLVVCASSAPHTLIGPEHLRQHSNPVTVIDLAVPRSVDPGVRELPGVRLIDVDDLRLSHDLRAPQTVLDKAEAAFAREFGALQRAFERRKHHRSIATLEYGWEQMRRQELERLRPKMPEVSAEEWTRIEGLTKRIIRKVVHPIVSGPAPMHP
jgi:glutamyl-tRNA reductase